MKLSIAVAIAWVALAVPTGVRAQMDDQFAWGVTAGAVVPANDLAKDHTVGLNGGVTFGFGGVGQLLGIRIDGVINQLSGKKSTDADAQILMGTLNLVMGVLGEGDRVYLTGGVGAYGIKPSKGGEKHNDFGLNGGVGLFIPGINGFIEARYHHFYRALANKRPAIFIPISVGVFF